MLLGWYDPDKKKPTRDKVREAMDRYREKFGGEPTTLLMNPAHGAEIPEGWPVLAGGAVVAVETRAFIPRNTFYVGVEDAPEDEE